MEISDLQQQLIHLCDELRKEQQQKSQVLATTELLELAVEASRESEKKLFDSLVSQTKQLEQTKISLEEAKLEIKHLNSIVRSVPDPRDVQKLRVELKQALDAEGKSKKAMDDLAAVLKEVTTESNRAKKSYFQAQSELERLRAENETLKIEAEESSAAWKAKENGIVNCMKISEEEIVHLKNENKRLQEAKIAAREEISNLRDIVKQAVKESNSVKQALEMTRRENSQLKDLLSERENVFNESKPAAAMADDDVEEMQSGQHGATLSMDYTRSNESVEVGAGSRPIVKFPSENWSARWKNNSKLLEGSIFDELTPMSPTKENSGGYNDQDMIDGDSPMRMKKKRQPFRRFGDMLRMKSFSK